MSWNQGGGGGPWGSGGGGPGPWGSGGGRGNFQPPNFEDALRRFQALLRRLLPGGGRSGLGGPRGWALGIAIVLVIWVMSGIYRVEPDEQGVVLRFGAFNRTATPGLNYHLPDPIEEALTPTVTRINRVEIGYRSDQALGRGGRMTEVPEEALDVDGRREHRRRQPRRVLAGEGRAGLCLQYPQSRGHRESGGRERDPRDHRPYRDRDRPCRRPHQDRSRYPDAAAGKFSIPMAPASRSPRSSSRRSIRPAL